MENLIVTICVILIGTILTAMSICLFEKSTREAEQAINKEYKNFYRCFHGRLENED